MSELPGLVFVSSEDDLYRVKGGIGTAVGILNDPRIARRLARDLRRHVIQGFSPEPVTIRMMNAYDRALEEKRDQWKNRPWTSRR